MLAAKGVSFSSSQLSSSSSATTANKLLLLSRRLFATGTRGARGHGWYLNYRTGKGGRHLQGEYHDRESLEECEAWNDAILQLGSTQVYMDIVAEPIRTTTVTDTSKKFIPTPPSLDTLEGDKHRIVIDLASTVMPETTQNFIDLLSTKTKKSNNDEITDVGYIGTRLYRIEKGVGIYGGDVLTNTGRTGKAAKSLGLTLDIKNDPLVLWHIPGTVTMLVPKVGEIDSRFMFITQPAPHIDGMCRAFGRMTKESLNVVSNWQTNLLTRYGVPTNFNLIITDCGILNDNNNSQSIESTNEETATTQKTAVESS